MLLLIALFVWVGAEGEARMVEERVSLRNIPVRAAMLTDYKILNPSSTLGQAAELLLAGAQQDFPVMGEGRARPPAHPRRAHGGAGRGGARRPPWPRPSYARSARSAPTTPVGPALIRLRDEGEGCLEVVEHGRPIGLLTPREHRRTADGPRPPSCRGRRQPPPPTRPGRRHPRLIRMILEPPGDMLRRMSYSPS